MMPLMKPGSSPNERKLLHPKETEQKDLKLETI